MRAQNDSVRAVGLGRIQDKTRWTKALGEAVAVVYGDWNGIAPSKHAVLVIADERGAFELTCEIQRHTSDVRMGQEEGNDETRRTDALALAENGASPWVLVR